LPPRTKLFRSVLVTQAFLLAFSLFVASREGIELFAPVALRARDVLLGAGACLALVGAMRPRWKHLVERRDPALYTRMPRDARERAWWIAVSASAGFGEEIAYRGVMYTIVTWAVGDPWVAAVVCALAFAAAHWVQGATNATIVFGIALLMHGIVAITGTLYVAMAIHFVYDVVAGLSYGYLGEKLGYPREGVPPCASPVS